MEIQVITDIVINILAATGASAWLATAIGKMSKSENKIVKVIGDVINVIGANVFNAKNK